MIVSFRHKGLKLWYNKNDKSLLDAKLFPRIRLIIDALEAAQSASDLDLPGMKWHELKGNRAGEFSVSVNKNWRITYAWNAEGAANVNLEDYH